MWYGSSGVVYAELPHDGSTDVVVRYAFSRTSVIWSLAEFVSMCCSDWLRGSTAMCWAELPVRGSTAYVLEVVPHLFATASFIAVSVLAVVPAFGRRNYRLS